MKKIKILLDNGHSSSKAKNITPGKRTPYLTSKSLPALEMYEGDFNRDIVKRIESKLKNLGYAVEIIVPEDEDISLTERVRRINKICSDKTYDCILISIHSNAAGNGKTWMTARGYSVHVCQGCSEKSKNLANSLYNAAEKSGKLKMRKPKPGQLYWENNFYITKKSSCPAVLSESGFYDNVDDCKYLLSEEGREDIANFHFQGILDYITNLK